jgi:TatD DNase family protein
LLKIEQVHPFVDIHTHNKPSYSSNSIVIRNLQAGEILSDNGRDFFSAGIHPWQLKQGFLPDLKAQLISMLDHPSIVAIGEAGLDRAIGINLDLQMQVFEMQADLAESLHKPLIIHAVRVYPEIIQLKKRMNPSSIWIIHGFAADIEAARQLLHHGFMFSVGETLFDSRRKISGVLPLIPHENLFFETDQSRYTIETIYQRAAVLLEISVEDLQSTIFANFVRCFK